MTINVIFTRGAAVAMIGDLMLTSDQPRTGAKLMFPPTPNNPPAADEIGRYFVGAEQKLATINPHLVVAWAGPLHLAQRVIERLKVGCATAEETIANLRLMIDDIRADPELAELSLTAVHAQSGQNEIHVVRAIEIQPEPLLLAAGSGWDEVREPFMAMYERTKFDGANISDVHRAELMALTWVGYQTQAQVRNRDAAKKWYGGGFEIAIADGQAVKKLDRIMHVLIGAAIDDQGALRLGLAYPLIYQFYNGPNLVTRYIYDDDMAEHIVLGHGYFWEPIARDLNFRPDYTTFVFEMPDGRHYYNSHIRGDEAPLEFAARDGRMFLQANWERIEHVFNMTGAVPGRMPTTSD